MFRVMLMLIATWVAAPCDSGRGTRLPPGKPMAATVGRGSRERGQNAGTLS